MRDFGRISYQWTLRQIGAFLDSRSGRRMTLIEVPDGFVLRYQTRDDAEVRVVHFPRRQLVARDVQQERMRLQQDGKRRRLSAGAPSPSPEPHPGSYQDFLRALGHELDLTSIYDLALDELDGSLIVTYLYVDPRHAFVPVKKFVTLEREQRGQILHDAYARREGETASNERPTEPTRFK